MVGENYHDFFLGSASAVGALIGLLFVAISVSPKAVTGRSEHHKERLKAATAMSAFLDALVVSMVALMPGDNLGTGSSIMAIAGIFSTVALAVTGLRAGVTRDPARALFRWSLLISAFLGLYIVQLVSALQINGTASDATHVKTHSILVIIMFIMGISRAWELVGGSSPRLIATFSHPGTAEPAGGDQPGDTA
ncbi:hypothetical protein ACIO1C_16935 [Streptomyces sp. NPDC087420]|uniref:hypothetical protein n=1 Tax=Streptomyces sp. NPDC087420 TaxID=3365785 RepID=UPI0038363BB3